MSGHPEQQQRIYFLIGRSEPALMRADEHKDNESRESRPLLIHYRQPIISFLCLDYLIDTQLQPRG